MLQGLSDIAVTHSFTGGVYCEPGEAQVRVIVIRNKKGIDIEYTIGGLCHEWKIRPNS